MPRRVKNFHEWHCYWRHGVYCQKMILKCFSLLRMENKEIKTCRLTFAVPISLSINTSARGKHNLVDQTEHSSVLSNIPPLFILWFIRKLGIDKVKQIVASYDTLQQWEIVLTHLSNFMLISMTNKMILTTNDKIVYALIKMRFITKLYFLKILLLILKYIIHLIFLPDKRKKRKKVIHKRISNH